MKHRTAIGLMVALGLMAVMGAKVAPTRVTLVTAGQPAATILIAQKPTKAAQLAADELRYHVKLITGVTLPIVSDRDAVKGTRILIGDSAATQALGLHNADFKFQEYLLDLRPATLILMGHDKQDFGPLVYNNPVAAPPIWHNFMWELATGPGLWDERGTLNATYEFIEDFLNVRWFRPSEFGMDYPHQQTLTVCGEPRRKTLAFRCLDCTPSVEIGGGDYNSAVSNWAPREPQSKASLSVIYADMGPNWGPADPRYYPTLRYDMALYWLRRRMGGEPFRSNHSFYGWYDRFWKQNPANSTVWEGYHAEYFCKEPMYNGIPAQLDFLNAAVIAQIAKDAREYFDSGKTHHGSVEFGNCFGLAPMDNSGFCNTRQTQAWRNDAARPDKTMFSNGLWSDYVWNYTNVIAKQLLQSNPDKFVTQAAYSDYAWPPTDKVGTLAPNIGIMMSIEVDQWVNPAVRQNMLNIIKGWRKKAPSNPLYVWGYYNFPKIFVCLKPTDFHFFPIVSGHGLDEQIKLFYRNGIRGIFMEDIPQDVDAYLLLKLCDDPTANVNDLLNEFFTRYYGHAAAPIKAIYQKMEAIGADWSNYLGTRDNTPEAAWGGLGTKPRVHEIVALFNQAQSLAQTDLEKRRLAVYKNDVIDYIVAGRKMYEKGKQSPP